MAVPGETECHQVAPCGSGPWGDIPVEVDTEYVDQSYVGGDSDGTAAKPWTTIQEGVASAEPGAIVAVAAGSYAEDVVISGTPVRLWGRCPELVEVVGTAAGVGAVFVRSGAEATEVRSLAIRGDAMGLVLSGSEGVLVDQVWVHDCAWRGVNAQSDFGPTSITVRRSLLENNGELGAAVSGSAATVEATVVRDTRLTAQGEFGRGMGVQLSSTSGVPSTVLLRGSVIERNHENGVFVGGSELTAEACVVRDTVAAEQGEAGRGVSAQFASAERVASTLILRGSLVERNTEIGVFTSGSPAVVDSTVVRHNRPAGDNLEARGIDAQPDPYVGEPSALTLRSSLVEGNQGVGVFLAGSTATVEGTTVRDTTPNLLGRLGRGVMLRSAPGAGAPSTLALRGAVIEHNQEVGVFIGGSVATVEATVVRNTQTAEDGWFGRGLHAEPDWANDTAAALTLRGAYIDENRESSVVIVSAAATVEASVIRNTAANGHGLGGDAIVVWSFDPQAVVTANAVRLEQSARAAIASFGGSVALGASLLACQSIDLAGNPSAEHDYAFEDLGGNLCGCPQANAPCMLDSAAIEPPEPIGGIE
jgi:hypothetical protein